MLYFKLVLTFYQSRSDIFTYLLTIIFIQQELEIKGSSRFALQSKFIRISSYMDGILQICTVTKEDEVISSNKSAFSFWNSCNIL